MKIEIEEDDIEAIANEVAETLKPLIAKNGESEEDEFLDVKGLAQYLKVSKQWIYERTHLNKIPHLKIDGQLRFKRKDIDKWVNTHNVPVVCTPESILKRLN